MIDTSIFFWENSYKQNINKMIGVGFRYTFDRQIAKDLAHDAFIIAYEKVSSYEGKGPFEAWLRRIMVNVCLQYLREQNKKKYLNDYLHNETNIVETYDENSNNKAYDFTEVELLEAINQLPEHHKLVFNMYVIDKFTHAQIGKELDISEGTSKSHLARARNKIKEILYEKVNSDKKQKRKMAALLLYWNIDGLYSKQFENFKIYNHSDFSFDALNPTKVSIPIFKPNLLLFGKFSEISLVYLFTSIAFLSFLFWKKSNDKTDYSEKKSILNINSKKTATIAKNPIIVKENKYLTKNEDSMKNLKALGAMLLTGSSLAMPLKGQNLVKVKPNINSQIDAKPTVSLNIQSGINPNVNIVTQIEPNTNVNTKTNINTEVNIDITGTFYAEKLRWSAENNELYFEGKALVKFGDNNFISNGASSFLGKVYYLVIDGKAFTLDEAKKKEIKLSTKKYNLTQLSPKSAIEKYGDAGKKGAVEISLAE